MVILNNATLALNLTSVNVCRGNIFLKTELLGFLLQFLPAKIPGEMSHFSLTGHRCQIAHKKAWFSKSKEKKKAGNSGYIPEDIWELLIKFTFCRTSGRSRLVKNILFLKGHHLSLKWDFFKTDVVGSQLKNKFWISWLTTKSVHVSLF